MAGAEWALLIDSGTTSAATRGTAFGDLASWFGPWVRPAAAGDGAPAGTITLSVDDGLTPSRFPAKPDAGGPAAPPSIERTPGGFRLAQGGYEVRVDRDGGRDLATVRCAPLYARTAARAAVRMLACRRVAESGGLALHASSVRAGGGLVVFAGPSGAGKTSAASTFPLADRLDQDLVLIGRLDDRWVRLDMFDEYEPWRFAPGEGAGLAVRAVLLPAAGEAFGLQRLSGSEAVRACLHAPAGWGAAEMLALMERVELLTGALPVARMEWSLGEELPRLLEAALA
jgi:hypothetical protein